MAVLKQLTVQETFLSLPNVSEHYKDDDEFDEPVECEAGVDDEDENCKMAASALGNFSDLLVTPFTSRSVSSGVHHPRQSNSRVHVPNINYDKLASLKPWIPQIIASVLLALSLLLSIIAISRSGSHEASNLLTNQKTEMCDEGWTYDSFGKACYKLFKEKLPWREAETRCNLHHSYLASLHTVMDRFFVESFHGTKDENPVNDFWIGGCQKDIKFEWIDGSEFREANITVGFYVNEGNSNSKRCLRKRTYRIMSYKDKTAPISGKGHHVTRSDCKEKYPYLCKKTVDVDI
ncbi:hypothetical protein L596_010595 [Steinernema carpocapsae]|uniref:C-type lectin domain-containing protein n=1 Tax=Steinernema carpocapsae TaxID=34508 RepID=A0A4U5PJF0_STECR|nr:hypothetical protein L596_010595 [Steinernema carpocapsae]